MARFQMLLTAVLCLVTKSMSSETHQYVNPDAPFGRNWNHSPPSQTLQQQQQHPPSVFLPTSTHHPAEGVPMYPQTQQSRHDAESNGRNFDSGDSTINSAAAAPVPSDHDSVSRHYGYLNVHRFDPNFPYYDRSVYLRYPFAQTPRYGPGYRKDKYGHGYGYSCKQGDDCDKVRAANQFPAAPPPPPMTPHHAPPQHMGSPYPDLHPMSHLPPYPQFNNHYPARFQDAPFLSPPPAHLYHGRYLHNQVEEQQQHAQMST